MMLTFEMDTSDVSSRYDKVFSAGRMFILEVSYPGIITRSETILRVKIRRKDVDQPSIVYVLILETQELTRP